MMIIKTKKMSAKDVKKKLHEFIDELAEDCGPDMEQMAEELKEHGDEFIDALSGEGSFRNGGSYRGGYRDNNGGGYRDGSGSMGGNYRGRAWHRNEGSWEEREELRKKNEKRLEEMDRMMQEMRQQLMQNY